MSFKVIALEKDSTSSLQCDTHKEMMEEYNRKLSSSNTLVVHLLEYHEGEWNLLRSAFPRPVEITNAQGL